MPLILSGRLTDWSVVDLLQILHVTGKTASLEVRGPEAGGTLFFRDGRLVDARVGGTEGSASGWERMVDAVCILRRLPDGSFSVGSHSPVDPSESFSVSEVLEAADRQLELEAELHEQGLLAGPVHLVEESEEPVTLAPEGWWLLARLAGEVDLADVTARVGRSRALHAFALLARLGLVRAVEEDAVEPPAASSSVPGGRQEEGVPADPPPESAGEGTSPEGEGAWQDESPADDEARVLAETAEAMGGSAPGEGSVDEDLAALVRRREMRAVITPAETTLVPGVLDDIRQRFRGLEQR